jgi:hypothetical protein
MRRVWLTGGAVAVGDGALLGTSAALGWTAVTVLAVLVGIAGALRVALVVPPPRPAARPATVTLGVPMRDSVEEPAPVPLAEEARSIVPAARETGAAPVAA